MSFNYKDESLEIWWKRVERQRRNGVHSGIIRADGFFSCVLIPESACIINSRFKQRLNHEIIRFTDRHLAAVSRNSALRVNTAEDWSAFDSETQTRCQMLLKPGGDLQLLPRWCRDDAESHLGVYLSLDCVDKTLAGTRRMAKEDFVRFAVSRNTRSYAYVQAWWEFGQEKERREERFARKTVRETDN